MISLLLDRDERDADGFDGAVIDEGTGRWALAETAFSRRHGDEGIEELKRIAPFRAEGAGNGSAEIVVPAFDDIGSLLGGGFELLALVVAYDGGGGGRCGQRRPSG